MIVAWTVDANVQSLLSVSMGSLKLNAPDFWAHSSKIVIDCGLSDSFRALLRSYRSEGVQVVPAPPLGRKASRTPGANAMWVRSGISSFISSLEGVNCGDPVLVCDADTVFLQAPDEFPFPDGPFDVTLMPGWILNDDGSQAPTPLLRSAMLNEVDLLADLEFVAGQLGLSVGEIMSIRSYNSGVFGFRAGREFDVPWHQAFMRVEQAVDRRGHHVFSAFFGEQNGISLCIHKGTIHAKELPRRFNCFAPRRPLAPIIPEDAVIVHFVNFHRMYRNKGYRLWFDFRDRLMALGFPSSDIPMPQFAK